MTLAAKKVLFYLGMLAPGLFFLALFTYTPLIRAVLDLLHDYRIVSEGTPFIGLDNYRRLLEDDNFRAAFRNNIIYILSTVIPGMILSLLLALALKKNNLINRWLRALFFFPTILRWLLWGRLKIFFIIEVLQGLIRAGNALLKLKL